MACLRTTTVNSHCFTNGNACLDNVGFGCKVFQNINSTSRYNTAIGYCALAGTGSHCKMHNVAIGYKAQSYSNATYTNAVAVGACTRAFTHAVAVGFGAIASEDAVAIGRCALADNGSSVAIGELSTAGLKGVSIGKGAGGPGDCSVVIGYNVYNGTGIYNTIIGASAANPNQQSAMTIVGFKSVGSECSIILGYYSQANNHANVIIIGSCITADDPNKIFWNTVYGGKSTIYTGWSYLSDCRDKTNVRPLEYNMGLPLVKNINPITFKWDRREKYVKKCKFERGVKDNTLKETEMNVGVLAQELKQTLTDMSLNMSVVNYIEDTDQFFVKDTQLFPSVIKSIQQLNIRLESIEDRIENLEQV